MEIEYIVDENKSKGYFVFAFINNKTAEVGIDPHGQLYLAVNDEVEFQKNLSVRERFKVLRFAYKALICLVREWEREGNRVEDIYAIPWDEQGGVPDQARRQDWLTQLGFVRAEPVVYLEIDGTPHRVKPYRFFFNNFSRKVARIDICRS